MGSLPRGHRLVRAVVIGVLVAVAFSVAVGFAGALRGREHPEVRWVRSFAAWAQPVERAIVDGDDYELRRCPRRFEGVAEPPSVHLANVLRRLVDACRDLAADHESSAAANRWWYGKQKLFDALIWGRPLPTKVTFEDESRIDPKIDELARDVFALDFEARCWSRHDWEILQEEWQILADEPDWWLAGVAEPGRGRIHLAPHVCAALSRFVHQPYQPLHNEGAVDLARALVVLAHEARHMAHPGALEATVECYALQDVRDLVRWVGRPAWYADELAVAAWELGYPGNYESYKSRECRNDGELDRRPGTDVWP